MDVRCKNCFKIFDNEYARCPFCGYSDGEPPKELYHLYPGTELLGRYVIGEVLGFGGFGITYKAWDKKFETILAIKEYYPSGIVNRNPGESEVILFTGKKKDIFDNGLVRFLDEAKNMAKFSQNNNIVNVFEYFEDNNTGYIVMEFLDGISLNSYLLKQTQKLPLDEIMTITMSVCSALRELHDIGIIHRDVSPDNIFMCSNGKIKLIDFGAARFSLNEEKKMTIILKPGFAPPEQYEKINKQGPWTDIYALGATVYLLLTGTKPDESTNRKIEDKVIPPSKLDPSIPEYISNTVMKAIALDKKNRFTSIDKFEKALLRKSKISSVNNNSHSGSSNKTKLISTIGIGAILLICLIFSVITILSNKKEILKATSITMWYSYGTEEDKDNKSEIITKLIQEFNKDYPKVTINAQGIVSSEYTNKLSQVISSGSGPNIYDSTYASADMLQNAVDSNEILKKLKISDYYCLENIKSNQEFNKRIPLGVNLPVVYVNTELIGQSIEQNNIAELGNLGSVDALKGQIGVNINYESMYKSIFAGDANYTDEYVIENAKNSFLTDGLPYYFSTTEDYYSIQEKLAGSYNILYISNGKATIKYSDCYSINNRNIDSNQKKAAIVLLRYMLSAYGQDILYISNKNNAIPINKEANKEYCKVNSEISKILQYSSDLK